jgi:hypothetical protein
MLITRSPKPKPYNSYVGSRAGRSLLCRKVRGRKVRTPQSSVPDNVREAGFKSGRRKVPQKTYRPAGALIPFDPKRQVRTE